MKKIYNFISKYKKEILVIIIFILIFICIYYFYYREKFISEGFFTTTTPIIEHEPGTRTIEEYTSRVDDSGNAIPHEWIVPPNTTDITITTIGGTGGSFNRFSPYNRINYTYLGGNGNKIETKIENFTTGSTFYFYPGNDGNDGSDSETPSPLIGTGGKLKFTL